MNSGLVIGTMLASAMLGEAIPSAGVSIDSLLSFASRFHPVVVHFPIALSMAALLAEVLSLFPKLQWASASSRFCILLAAAGAIAAGVTGWLKFTHGPMAGVTPDDATNLHRWVGTASGGLAIVAAALSLLTSVLPQSTKARWTYRAVLVLAVAIVGFSGHLGGLLVFGSDHFNFSE